MSEKHKYRIDTPPIARAYDIAFLIYAYAHAPPPLLRLNIDKYSNISRSSVYASKGQRALHPSFEVDEDHPDYCIHDTFLVVNNKLGRDRYMCPLCSPITSKNVKLSIIRINWDSFECIRLFRDNWSGGIEFATVL